ncbi:Uncharacterised protein [Vibrio cholerae]|nr:Uncharacterised protein [Vibrio cholerae]CSI31454.1 Uncharacterised protein [Vibrio cholerae]
MLLSWRYSPSTFTPSLANSAEGVRIASFNPCRYCSMLLKPICSTLCALLV